MNIIRKENEEHLFDEVDVGEIFEYDNSIFMRFGETVSNDYVYNAIRLEDGIITFFMNNDVIRFVDADLVIH